MRIALGVAMVASLLQLVTGHDSGKMIAKHQPAKLAAFEGIYETGPRADLSIARLGRRGGAGGPRRRPARHAELAHRRQHARRSSRA